MLILGLVHHRDDEPFMIVLLSCSNRGLVLYKLIKQISVYLQHSSNTCKPKQMQSTAVKSICIHHALKHLLTLLICYASNHSIDSAVAHYGSRKMVCNAVCIFKASQ